MALVAMELLVSGRVDDDLDNKENDVQQRSEHGIDPQRRSAQVVVRGQVLLTRLSE